VLPPALVRLRVVHALMRRTLIGASMTGEVK